jgi:hypothetical protein
LEDIKTEIVSITEYSNETNCVESKPIDENIFDNDIIIPTDDCLSRFIHWEFGDYFNDNVDSSDHKFMMDRLRNFLIAIIKENLLRNTLAPNVVATKRIAG